MGSSKLCCPTRHDWNASDGGFRLQPFRKFLNREFIEKISAFVNETTIKQIEYLHNKARRKMPRSMSRIKIKERWHWRYWLWMWIRRSFCGYENDLPTTTDIEIREWLRNSPRSRGRTSALRSRWGCTRFGQSIAVPWISESRRKLSLIIPTSGNFEHDEHAKFPFRVENSINNYTLLSSPPSFISCSTFVPAQCASVWRALL